MNSREKVLEYIQTNQPDCVPLPVVDFQEETQINLIDKLRLTLNSVGGNLVTTSNYDEIAINIIDRFGLKKPIVNIVDELNYLPHFDNKMLSNAHYLNNIEVAIIKAHFAVAENGAVWVTEDLMGHRVLPFICQHLAVVIYARDILNTMHEAYQQIGSSHYSFGTFIAGPSKTADIEQSLVFGAHGPRSMTVFVVI